MDEISPLGTTHVVEIRDGSSTEWTIDPAHYGLARGHEDELTGGAPKQNASAVLAVLEGSAPPTATSAVLLNAAAAVYVSAGGFPEFGGALDAVRAALRDGLGMDALNRLRLAYRVPELS